MKPLQIQFDGEGFIAHLSQLARAGTAWLKMSEHLIIPLAEPLPSIAKVGEENLAEVG